MDSVFNPNHISMFIHILLSTKYALPKARIVIISENADLENSFFNWICYFVTGEVAA